MLRTLPWSRVEVEVVLVELGGQQEEVEDSRKEMHQYLTMQGYKYVGTIGRFKVLLQYLQLRLFLLETDDIFMRGDLLDEKYRIQPELAASFPQYHTHYEDQPPLSWTWQEEEEEEELPELACLVPACNTSLPALPPHKEKIC